MRHCSTLNTNKFVRTQFIINLDLLEDQRLKKHLKCVYWNFTEQSWQNNGCFESQTESAQLGNSRFYRIVCYCNHLTNFAILFDPTRPNLLGSSKISSTFSQILSIISLIGVVVSSTCYIIIVFTRFLGKKCEQHKDQSLRHLYLANTICLLLANILFLAVCFVKPRDFVSLTLCQLSAALLHYSLLAAFCFSLATAWYHFRKLVKIFNNYKKTFLFFRFKWLVGISLVLPLAFTIPGYLIENEFSYSYMKYELSCWLQTPHLYYLFVAPLTVLLLISLYFYVFVVNRVLNIYKKQCIIQSVEKLEAKLNTKYNQKRIIVLLTFSFVSLSLTWLFGTLITIMAHVDEYAKIVLDCLFCMFNCFHGLSLLVAHLFAQRFSRAFHLNIISSSLKRSSEEMNSSNKSNVVEVHSEKIELKLKCLSRFYVLLYRLFGCFYKRFSKNSTIKNQPSGTQIYELTILENNADIYISSF